MNRRSFIKLVGITAGTAAGARPARAFSTTDSDGASAILVDLTQCVGCRTCEEACAAANGLPEPDWSDDFSYEEERLPTESRFTAVSRYETDKGEVFVKRNCMHCVEPACAAGCLTKALHKTPEGPVVWDGDKCMGCRFCMISCPFDGPKFEYHSANPRIQKCQMCFSRISEGERPACVENCPAEALTFGTRRELLEVARERIYRNPGDYVSHIYGEDEVGGTSWLYISPVPFEDLGFPTDLGTEAYPEKTRDFLTAVPLVLLIWPAMLMALRRSTAARERTEEGPTAGDDRFPGPRRGDLLSVPSDRGKEA